MSQTMNSQPINLKRLEQNAWRSMQQDGLLELFFGMLLMSSALGQFMADAGATDLQRIPSYVSLMLLSGVGLWAGKKYITNPRMGRVKFGERGKTRKRRANLVMLVAFVVTWAIFASVLFFKGNSPPEWFNPELIFPVVVTTLLFATFSLIAFFLENPRLYIVAAAFAIGEPAHIAFDKSGQGHLHFIAYLVPGIVVVAMGLIVFVRFLRENEPLTEESAVEEASNS